MSDTSKIDHSQAAHRSEWEVDSEPQPRPAWRVFPVIGKRPALETDWRKLSTADPSVIRGWVEQGYGLALDCGASRVLVVDADPGADLAPLDLPGTYSPKTPRGQHFYYAGAASTSAGKLGPHIDTRGVGGYVVIYDAGVMETLCEGGSLPAIAPLPAHIQARLEPREAKAVARDETPATDADFARAKLFLSQRTGAEDGETFNVINRLLDLGDFTDEQLLGLLSGWNGRPDEHLLEKIEHARKYRQNDAGAWAAGDPLKRFQTYLKGEAPSLLDPWAEFIAPAFPLPTLPPRLRAFVERKALSIGGDTGAVAMAALAACSGALDHGFHARMQVHDNWHENPRLWVLLVGDPSSKKTPIINAALRPLEAAAAANAKRQAEEDRGYADALRAAQGKIALPERTWFPRYIAQDITVESVGELLSRQSRGLLIKYDELAGWIGSMDKYGGSKAGMSDRAFWLKTYDGGHYQIDRKSTGSKFVQNCSVAFLGGIQPDRIADLGNVVSDGLLQRFLPVLMRPADRSQDLPGGSAVADYENLIGQLLRLGAKEITLSAEAREVKVSLETFLHDVTQTQGLSSSLRAFAGKLTGVWGRLALVLHLAGDPDYGTMQPVSGAVAEAADRLVRTYLLPHAVAFYDRATDGVQQANMRDLASYVLTSGKARFVASDFTTNVRFMRGMKGWDVFTAVDVLVAGGWLEPDSEHVPTKAWTILPSVREALAERRAVEAERKAAVVKIMRSLGP
jgi:Protein of unknown function (DUF3987)/Bifunctional DNA primase/polymerase, N-terminal